MATLQLVQVHTPDQAREIIAGALQIALATELNGEWGLAIFNKAVDLLAARIPLQQINDLGVSFDALGMRR